MRDELIERLDEVDRILRDEIQRTVESGVYESGWLASLLRCRADVQGAITNLLGSCH